MLCKLDVGIKAQVVFSDESTRDYPAFDSHIHYESEDGDVARDFVTQKLPPVIADLERRTWGDSIKRFGQNFCGRRFVKAVRYTIEMTASREGEEPISKIIEFDGPYRGPDDPF